jgi:hypothetical protein
MKHLLKYQFFIPCVVILVFSLVACTNAFAQKQKAIAISATAMGTSTQLGRVISVDIRINGFSTPEDQRALLEAFGEGGSKGLTNALEKMGSNGRIAITGTLGFDLKYIRLIKMEDGSTKIRFVTDRPIRFGEAWASTRSMDYSLAMGEIVIGKGKGNSSGTLIPAAEMTLDKAGLVQVEAFQNPWKLTNIRVWD